MPWPPRDHRAPPTAKTGDGLFWYGSKTLQPGAIIGRYHGRQLGPVSAFEGGADTEDPRITGVQEYTLRLQATYKREEWLAGLEDDGQSRGCVFLDGKDSQLGFQYANCAPADKANVKVNEWGYVHVIRPIKDGVEILWDYGDLYWSGAHNDADAETDADADEPDDAEAPVSDAEAETTNGRPASVGYPGSSKRKQMTGADADLEHDDAESADAESDADAETTNGGLALVGCSGASKRKLTAKQKQAIKDAKKKKARTSTHLEAADGGAVPVRRDVVKLNLGARALVTGCKRTCLPDAVRMLLYDVQQTVERSDACKAMPWSQGFDPTVAMAMMYVAQFNFTLVPACILRPTPVYPAAETSLPAPTVAFAPMRATLRAFLSFLMRAIELFGL